jgi:hypothetical protein
MKGWKVSKASKGLTEEHWCQQMRIVLLWSWLCQQIWTPYLQEVALGAVHGEGMECSRWEWHEGHAYIILEWDYLAKRVNPDRNLWSSSKLGGWAWGWHFYPIKILEAKNLNKTTAGHRTGQWPNARKRTKIWGLLLWMPCLDGGGAPQNYFKNCNNTKLILLLSRRYDG